MRPVCAQAPSGGNYLHYTLQPKEGEEGELARRIVARLQAFFDAAHPAVLGENPVRCRRAAVAPGALCAVAAPGRHSVRVLRCAWPVLCVQPEAMTAVLETVKKASALDRWGTEPHFDNTEGVNVAYGKKVRGADGWDRGGGRCAAVGGRV